MYLRRPQTSPITEGDCAVREPGGRGAAGPAEIAWLGWAARLSSPILPPSRHSGLCMVDYRLRRAGDDPTPTHPPQGKNHSRVQLLDALCYGSIKPSSLAPLTSFPPKPFPPIFLHRHLRPSFSTTISDIVTTFPIHPRHLSRPLFPLLDPHYYCITRITFSRFPLPHLPLDLVGRRICSVAYHLRLCSASSLRP